MKVIYTKNFPPGKFHGINICGLIFAQRRWGTMKKNELNHELIHTMQQIEMVFILFYLWYGVEYLVRLIQYKGDSMKAYYSISLEREAYANEKNPNYKKNRKPYSWIKYLVFKTKKR